MEKNETEKVTAASLSFDSLVSIFKFLDTRSKGKAAQACSSWKAAADSASVWKGVEVKIRSGNISAHSEHSIIKRRIKWFTLYVFEPSVNEFLRRVPSLEYLRFNRSGQCKTTESFDIIQDFATSLERGSIENFQIPQEILSTTISNINLRSQESGIFPVYYAKFYSNRIPNTYNVLKTFTTGLKQLKILDFDGYGCTHWKYNIDLFAEEATTSDNRLTNLKILCLRYFWKLREELMNYICRKFANLVYLEFEGCQIIPTNGFANLSKLEKLEFLSFYNSFGVTDALLSNVSHLSNLKFFDLGACEEITDNGLEIISRLTNLMYLNFKRLRVTDAAFWHLIKLPHLRELGLHSSTISDIGLFYLAAGNLKLTKLNICNCRNVTDQGLFSIYRSTFDLHSLNISRCTVTDYGVRRIIEKFSYLKTFDVSYCSSVTDKIKQLVAETLRRNKES